MVYAEALAHGLPIIATTAGAIPETVPATASLLVPPGDATALRNALRRMFTDANLRARLAAGAAVAAAALPDWPTAVHRWAAAVCDRTCRMSRVFAGGLAATARALRCGGTRQRSRPPVRRSARRNAEQTKADRRSRRRKRSELQGAGAAARRRSGLAAGGSRCVADCGASGGNRALVDAQRMALPGIRGGVLVQTGTADWRARAHALDLAQLHGPARFRGLRRRHDHCVPRSRVERVAGAAMRSADTQRPAAAGNTDGRRKTRVASFAAGGRARPSMHFDTINPVTKASVPRRAVSLRPILRIAWLRRDMR